MDKPFCPNCEREFESELKFCPHDGAELIYRSEDTMSGEVFDGRYRVLHKIGEGGMGAVYKALQMSTGKPVAIKVVAKHLTENPATVRRFQREVRLQSKLEHPNVVSLIDFSQTPDGQYYFVMSFVEGRSLRNLILEKGALPASGFKELAVQILDALQYAHGKGVIHRDIKGENIVITEYDHQRVAQILDFGLAKAVQEEGSGSSAELTKAGRVLGTPAYMSPEQAMGEVDKIGPRSDIYSAGVVFYHMLTGKLPFESNTPWGYMHKHINEPPLSIKDVNPKIPDDISRIVLRCMAKDRDKRYQSALAVKRDLEKVTGLEQADRTEDAGPSYLEETIEAKRGVSLAGVLGILIVLLAAGGGVWGYLQTEQAKRTDRFVTALGAAQGDHRGNVEKKRKAEAERKRKAEAERKRRGRIERLYMEAESDFKSNRLTSPEGRNALEKFQAILKIDPGNEPATKGIERIAIRYVEMADKSWKEKDYARAESYVAKAETISPDTAEVRDAVKELESGKAELKRQEEEKRKVAEAEAIHQLSLARSAAKDEDFELAEELVSKAEKLAPGLDVVKKARGKLKTARGKWEKAQVTRLLRHAQESAGKGDFSSADKYLKRAESIAPNNPVVKKAKTRLAERRAEQEAKRKAEEERKRKQALAEEYIGLAERYLKDRDLKKAEELIGKAESLTPASAKVKSLRAALTEKKKVPADMVFVKGGCFDMGDTFGDGYSHEKPVHRVCVDDFKMDKYEVTQAAYRRATGNNPSRFSGCSGCPVEKVTWYEARDYCSSVGKRLPTEAEWEYAARERGKRVRFGNGENTIGPDTANFDARSKYKRSYSRSGRYREQTVPVGSFSPNSLGLYDMAGNVWEWVSDWYGKDYYNGSPRNNPQGPSSGKWRVLRGGGWHNDPIFVRAADRGYDTPTNRFYTRGFRCAQ